jgi:hypothetical protein
MKSLLAALIIVSAPAAAEQCEAARCSFPTTVRKRLHEMIGRGEPITCTSVNFDHGIDLNQFC